jgi:hypothetical protein
MCESINRDLEKCNPEALNKGKSFTQEELLCAHGFIMDGLKCAYLSDQQQKYEEYFKSLIGTASALQMNVHSSSKLL